MRYGIILVSVIFFLAVPARSQHMFQSTDIAVDSSGNFYISGRDSESGFLIIKYNAIGVQQYELSTPNSIHSDAAAALHIDPQGNIYATGSAGDSLISIKYNRSGVRQWHRTLLPAEHRLIAAADVAVDSAGNVFAAATVSGQNNDSDILLIKYNANGFPQWNVLYDSPGPAADSAVVLGLDAAGNVYCGGTGSESATSGSDYLLLKYNSNGVKQWAVFYNKSGNDYGRDMRVTAAGNVCITGVSYTAETGYDIATVLFNSTGVSQWHERYNAPSDGNDGAAALTRDINGFYYIAGTSQNDTSGQDFTLLKYNASGVKQWHICWNGEYSLDDTAVDVQVDSAGYAVVAGNTQHPSSGSGYALVRYNPAGVRQWTAIYHHFNESNERAQSMVMDRSGSVCLTGSSGNTIGGADIATAKYSSSGVQLWISRYGHDPAGVEQDSPPLPQAFKVFPNHPNPFNTETVIPFYSPQAAEIQLDVYNLRGQRILSKNFFTTSGPSKVRINANNLESGMYFFQLYFCNLQNFTGKMVLIK